MYTIEFLALFNAGDCTLGELTEVLLEPDSFWDRKISRQEGEGAVIGSAMDGEFIRIKPFELELLTGWTIRVSMSNIDKVEFLRYFIASQIRSKFKVLNLHLLVDEVSLEHAAAIYPKLHRIENKIRQFLTHFFIPLAGSDWLKLTGSKKMLSKIEGRREHSIHYLNWKWSKLLDDHLNFLDFRELGALITTQTIGLNEPEQIVERVEDLTNWDDLLKLREEMQSNYSRFFKESFKDNQFHMHWRQLQLIRDRVAHSSLLADRDVLSAENLVTLIETILEDATSNRAEMEPPAPESEPAVLNAPEAVDSDPAAVGPQEEDYSDLMPKLTILGKIDLSKVPTKKPRRGSQSNDETEPAATEHTDRVSKIPQGDHSGAAVGGPAPDEDEKPWIIEPDELLDALDEFTSDPRFDESRFFALSTFQNMLEEEGFDRASVRRLAFSMAGEEDSEVEIYTYEDPDTLNRVTSIRLRERASGEEVEDEKEPGRENDSDA